MADPAFEQLSLRDLRILQVLLRECSITRAAEVLETTQPQISKRLAYLRSQFGDQLLVRNGHAMQPTAKGLEVAPQLKGLLDTADGLQADARVFEPATSDRLFGLLVTDVGMVRFLPPLLARMAETAPRLRLRAVPLGSWQIESKLESGEADLALGAFPRAASHLRRQQLYSDGYVSVVRKEHPRLREIRSLPGFSTGRHILTTASEIGHAAHGQVERAISAKIAPSNILLRVPSFLAGAIVAAQTDGIATLPENLAASVAAPLGLAVFKTPLQLPRIEIAQYWHERFHRDAAHRWLRAVTFELFGERRRHKQALR
ncbi:LysR family transcriptional regulator [Bradyrhizobium sp.]|uniref:LysR family transcriptional regulator n=1 Tax=Bradyrhizobium sp. TaxID=376 RepID=UPI0025BB8837|nr:LysR family transcriptional regulator [Bradyrhizobium sp.]MBV8922606.1 LysR family transcriptional regulator [Bradyrhizobium sp.]